MKIQSKFNENDKVWFFNVNEGKFFEGVILSIESWDKYSGFRYNIKHTGLISEFTDVIDERLLYMSKSEIVNTCFIELLEDDDTVGDDQLIVS